jgi:hypothetical protein
VEATLDSKPARDCIPDLRTFIMFPMVSEGALLQQAFCWQSSGNLAGLHTIIDSFSSVPHFRSVSHEDLTQKFRFLTTSLEFNGVSDLALWRLSTLA